jgi:hypothetical protein
VREEAQGSGRLLDELATEDPSGLAGEMEQLLTPAREFQPLLVLVVNEVWLRRDT